MPELPFRYLYVGFTMYPQPGVTLYYSGFPWNLVTYGSHDGIDFWPLGHIPALVDPTVDVFGTPSWIRDVIIMHDGTAFNITYTQGRSSAPVTAKNITLGHARSVDLVTWGTPGRVDISPLQLAPELPAPGDSGIFAGSPLWNGINGTASGNTTNAYGDGRGINGYGPYKGDTHVTFQPSLVRSPNSGHNGAYQCNQNVTSGNTPPHADGSHWEPVYLCIPGPWRKSGADWYAVCQINGRTWYKIKATNLATHTFDVAGATKIGPPADIFDGTNYHAWGYTQVEYSHYSGTVDWFNTTADTRTLAPDNATVAGRPNVLSLPQGSYEGSYPIEVNAAAEAGLPAHKYRMYLNKIQDPSTAIYDLEFYYSNDLINWNFGAVCTQRGGTRIYADSPCVVPFGLQSAPLYNATAAAAMNAAATIKAIPANKYALGMK